LTARRQKVGVGEELSSWAEVLSGVPEGSVLGPVNDMPEMVSSFIFLYADDAKNSSKGSRCEDMEQLQIDLNSLGDWSRKWLLQFNLSKCKVMHFGKRLFSFQYSRHDVNGNFHTLQETTEE